ncbi:unnamed protein product [Rhizopus stolonifer]
MLHRTGQRKLHTAKKLTVHQPVNQSISEQTVNINEKQAMLEMDGTIINNGGPTFGDYMTNCSKSIPLRLDSEERQLLKLLEAALNVSEYTDKVDIISYSNKSKRIVAQIRDLCAIIAGLFIAGNYKQGSDYFSKHNLRENEDLFQRVFEVGRRHKIMNPEKMRSTYGKLMYMLMDSVIPEVEDYLGFSCVIPIKTVYDFLKSRECVDLLHDDNIVLATREISIEFKTREQVDNEVTRKQSAIQSLCEKYSSESVSKEDVERCILSISDNNAFLKANR